MNPPLLSVTIIPRDGARTRTRHRIGELSGILSRSAQNPRVLAVHVWYPNGTQQLFELAPCN